MGYYDLQEDMWTTQKSFEQYGYISDKIIDET